VESPSVATGITTGTAIRKENKNDFENLRKGSRHHSFYGKLWKTKKKTG